jgi:hypothetical protein
MKKSILVLLALGSLLLTSPSVVSASPAGGEICARNPQDVNESPVLKSTMKTFGGASNIFGSWKLAGLAGVFAKVSVTLTASRSSFAVQVDDSEPNDFWLCVDPAQPDVFKMRVQNPRESENALFLLKAREPGRTVMVAAVKTKWKFMKFKRRSSDD